MNRIHSPRRRTVLVSTLALAAAGARAQTADFPTKPITLVVPFAPGGSTDVTARRVAEEMQKTLRTSVVIENKPGAGSFVATTQVVKSPKDGYTIGVITNAGVVSGPVLATHRRTISAPILEVMVCGSTVLPSDLLILRPWPSVAKPWVSRPR